jgi:hypothetical protein
MYWTYSIESSYWLTKCVIELAWNENHFFWRSNENHFSNHANIDSVLYDACLFFRTEGLLVDGQCETECIPQRGPGASAWLFEFECLFVLS